MLGRTLAGMSLLLHDIEGEKRIDELDHDRILTDLRDAGTPARQLVWLSLQSLAEFDRILLARDKQRGTCTSALLVRNRSVGDTPFLAIDAVCGGPAQRQEAMLKRMLGYLILRFGTLDRRPAAILAHTRNPALCRAMHNAANRIGNAGFYPEPDGNPIVMRTAALAHCAARQTGSVYRFDESRQALHAGAAERTPEGPLLAMLDLRFMDEARLDEDARHLFRDRLPRAATRRPVAAVLPMRRPEERRLPAHIAAQALRGGTVVSAFRR